MKLENQVCSLDLAKRLKELGVKQESLFYWCEHGDGEHIIEAGDYNCDKSLVGYSAFTVAELGEMLPWPTYSGQFVPETGGYIVKNEDFAMNFTADTEADARAKMIIYLLENNLLTPER